VSPRSLGVGRPRAAEAHVSQCTCSGCRLRRCRLRLAVTQRKLAGLLGVTLRTVCRWETGAAPIPRATLMLVERFVADLYSGATSNGPSLTTKWKGTKMTKRERMLRAIAAAESAVVELLVQLELATGMRVGRIAVEPLDEDNPLRRVRIDMVGPTASRPRRGSH